MTNLPTFRVFPKTNSFWNSINDNFPGGIPCDKIINPYGDCLIPNHYALNVSLNQCLDSQASALIYCIQQHNDISECEILSKGIYINFDHIDKVFIDDDKQIHLSLLKDSLIKKLDSPRLFPNRIGTNPLDMHAILKALITSINTLVELDRGLVNAWTLIAGKLICELAEGDQSIKTYYLYCIDSRLHKQITNLIVWK